jgi:biopolymer transport protein ExbB
MTTLAPDGIERSATLRGARPIMMNNTLSTRPIAVLSCLLCGLALLLTGSQAAAASFDQAEGKIDAKLEASLAELSSVRNTIAKEKVPLSREVSKLENEVLALERRRAELFEERDARSIDLDKLRRQVESLAQQDEFVNSRLNEFVRDFEGRLHISELPRYEALTAAAKLSQKNVNLDAEARRATQIAVVQAALDRMDAQLGGQIFAGEALSPEGVLVEGSFLALGPTVFFDSNDDSVRGLVESQLNAADPVVVALPDALLTDLASVTSTGRGLLPFDATLGKAIKQEKARKSIGQYVEDGGVVGYVIIGLGIAALVLTGFKMADIMGFPVATPDQVDGVLSELAEGSFDGALKQARAVKGVAGDMLELGVENSTEKRALLEEMLFERILRVRPRLERFLPFLAITAAASPLLGLLGTVIGMIKTFQLITIFGTGDAKSLSSGISEALVTTALGLCVAIPTLILHGALSRMARHKVGLLEQISVAFVNGVSSLRSDRRADHEQRGGSVS